MSAPESPISQQEALLAHEEETPYPICLDSMHGNPTGTPLDLSDATKNSSRHSGTDGKQPTKQECADSIVKKTVSRMHHHTEQEEQADIAQELLNDNQSLKCYIQVIEKRNEELAVALEKQKLKVCHLEQALSLMRKQDRQLDKKINEQSDMFTKLKQQYQTQKDVNESLCSKFEQSQAENTYLKELILIANSNYENIDKKYQQALSKCKTIQEEYEKKQKQMNSTINQMKNLLTDLIVMPNNGNNLNAHYLSFGENDENFVKKNVLQNTNRCKKQIDDAYRKIFMKTLKGNKL